jgi:hypothetical protein
MAISIVLCQALVDAAAKSPGATLRNYLSGAGRVWVQQALERAIQRVQQPGCRQLFSDFSDPAGVPLSARLHDAGVTPEDYLMQWMVFLDGSTAPQCRLRDTAAFTERRGRIVYVCASRVVGPSLSSSGSGEIILIHEMLHSLGLSENPPTPDEITTQVIARCAR